MKRKFVVLGMLLLFLYACKTDNSFQQAMRGVSQNGRWVPYGQNPILTPATGTWDAGALGSMTTVIVNDTMHMYYEAWGTRSHNPDDPDEDYSSLQIGHAISLDGLHWEKDKRNPVVPKGVSGEWDHMGTWDPFVIHEDGIFKMWYGGGISDQCDWGYAESTDGVHFVKKGKISDLRHVEDVHVIHDLSSNKYYLYYWNRAYEPNGLFVAESPNEMDFDFAKARPIKIKGESYPGMYKFTHVIQEDRKWYMFYSDFVRPGCSGARIRLATSSDGLNWETVNKNLLEGMDGDIIKVGDDLYAMYYGPEGYFDQKDCDIRVAVYNGRIGDLIVKK